MATNRIDILDPALLRPGRIDRKIEFPAPSEQVRGGGGGCARADRAGAAPLARAAVADGGRGAARPWARQARLDILKIHSRKMNLTRGINLRKIAEMMPGASGAEVKGVCTEAGMYALRERRVHVNQEDFEMAVSKVMQRDADKNMSLKKLFK